MHPKRLNSDTFANLTFVSHFSLETVETISSCQQVKKRVLISILEPSKDYENVVPKHTDNIFFLSVRGTDNIHHYYLMLEYSFNKCLKLEE